MTKKIKHDIQIPRFIHSFGLKPSSKLIYSYIYDIIKHEEVDEPIYIDPETLATFGCVESNNRALAITRELESIGLIKRGKSKQKSAKDNKIHTIITFSLPNK